MAARSSHGASHPASPSAATATPTGTGEGGASQPTNVQPLATEPAASAVQSSAAGQLSKTAPPPAASASAAAGPQIAAVTVEEEFDYGGEEAAIDIELEEFVAGFTLTRAFRLWRHNVSSIIVYNHGASQPVAGIEGDALSCDLTLAELLETVTGAHCLIAHFLGEDYYRDGIPFVEVYALRRTRVRVWRASWYDVQWLRSWSWLCVCRGPYENGSGCAKSWRRRGWVCPDLLPYL